MKILTTIHNLESISLLSSQVDGFLIGNDQFGTRLTKSFGIHEIIDAIQLTSDFKKELFLVCNQMFNDDQLDDFKNFLAFIPIQKLSGIIVADIGAYRLISSLGYKGLVVYNPETLLTNVYDFNFLAKNHIKGAYIAKEITLSDIIEIAKNKEYQMFMVGHGHLDMFYSKRQLIENFMKFNEDDHHYHNQKNLKIIESNRLDEAYPILEDNAGTHVFRGHVFSSLKYLNDFKELLDYLVIDTIFKDDSYASKILPMYHQNQIDTTLIEELQKAYDETWDDGFFFKKTIYKSKGNSND
ncbi:MAG: U32 family peptidase [Acholeplasmataceae bacterium]|nr:U32 family peptidase [Acholeplasmataceae bacterium]